MSTSAFNDLIHYRYIIQKAVEYDKPLVLFAEYNGLCISDNSKMTFKKLTPYLPENYTVTVIADHVNLRKSDCLQYIQESSFTKGHKFIIVARPYIYKNKIGDIKGGLLLSNELEKFGIKAINHYSLRYSKYLPYNFILDFRKEFGGAFGWKKPTKYSIELTSENDLIEKNSNTTKFSLSILYNEKLNTENINPNNINIEFKEDIEDDSSSDIYKDIAEERYLDDNFILNILDNHKDKEIEEFDDQVINFQQENIVIDNKLNEINPKIRDRDIDSNIKEYSSIKAPSILLPKLPNGLVIPPYRRK